MGRRYARNWLSKRPVKGLQPTTVPPTGSAQSGGEPSCADAAAWMRRKWPFVRMRGPTAAEGALLFLRLTGQIVGDQRPPDLRSARTEKEAMAVVAVWGNLH